jgi:MoaA/NifB/PqqE/SkfB family radical SAM enzyme
MTPQIPNTILLDTTNFCNARCPFCPLFAGEWQMDRRIRPAEVMTQKLFERIVGEIGEWTQNCTLVMSSNAEILQDPMLDKRLRALRAQGVAGSTVLLTNGQLLDGDAAVAILDAGISRMIVGFDGASREVYEAHRVRCNYDRVLNNIRGFVGLRRRHANKTVVELKFVRTRKNEHEVAAAYDLFRGILDPDIDLFHDALAVDWSDGMGQTPDYYFVERGHGRRLTSCAYFETGMQVHSDGRVAACCWDYNLTISSGGLGDLNTSSLMDVWTSASRVLLRSKLQRDEDTPDKCKMCLMLHEAAPPGDGLMKIPAEHLEARGPTSFIYRFAP